MIANFFKKSNPANQLFLAIILIVTYATSCHLKINSFSWFTAPLTIFTIITYYITITKNEFNLNYSFTLLFLIILIGYFPQILNFNSILLSNAVLSLSLYKIYSLKFPVRTESKVFDAGFWIGVAALFNPILIVFFTLLLSAILLNHYLKIKILALAIIGLFTPMFLYFTYCFFINDLNFFIDFFKFKQESILEQNYALLYNLFAVVIVTVMSFTVRIKRIIKSSDKLFANGTLIIIHYIISACTIFFLGLEGLIYALFPSAVIIANGLNIVQNKIITDGILIIMIINLLIPYLNI